MRQAGYFFWRMLMINIDLDFETRSGKDLSTCGSLPYLWDKRADIVCLGNKVS